MRWIPHPDGGSLVAAFAPVADWTQAHPPAPTGVQLLHLDPEGRPREDGAVIAAGGTAAFRNLAPTLFRIGAPVAIHADGDTAGIVAARHLSAALAAGGAVAGIIQYPPGCDPADSGGK